MTAFPARVSAWSPTVGQPVERPVQDDCVKEEQRARGLVLRRGAHTSSRQMSEERIDLGCAEGLWMTLTVEENETANPRDVRSFRVRAVMLRTDNSAYAVEKTRR